MKKHLLSLSILLLFCLIGNFLSAQCTTVYPGSCAEPVSICDADLDGGLAIDMTLGVTDPSITLCANGFANNITYIGFTAGSTTLTFELVANQCNVINNPGGSGAGIQWGLFEAISDCETTTDYDEIVSNCNASGQNATITITNDNFIVGNDYVLFIDGWSGSVCEEMTVELINGIIGIDVGDVGEPDPVFDGDLFDPPLVGNELCLGGTIDFNVNPPATPNANLQITIDPPTTQFPTGIIDLPLGTFSATIDFDEPGMYEICGFAFNCCDSSAVECETFTVIPIAEDILPDEAVCQNALADGYLPVGWEGPAIFAPGDYSIDLESANFSCDFVQSITITEIPLQPAEFVNMLVCDPNNTFITDICNTTVGGDQFNTQVICPDNDMNGCDSIIFLTLDFVNVPAVLFDPECIDGMLEFQLGAGLPNPIGLYEVNFTMFLDGVEIWTANNDDWDLFNDRIVVPIESGNYTVEISVERFGTECIFVSNNINASGNGLIPDDPEIDIWNLNPCVLDSLTYSLSADNDPDNEYIWNITPSGDVVIDTTNTEIGINWENAIPGTTYTICVEADNGCGTSEQVCEDVEVIAQPLASFSLPDSVCLNSDAILEYNGTSLIGGDYTWNFDGGTIDVGDPNSPGPFNVSYSTTGKKLVSVLVSQGACTSEIFVDSIVVVDELAEPFISCMSATDNVEFTWDVIADDYIVDVNDAPAGAIFTESDGVFTVTGLNPNDVVEITLTAVDNGVCNNVFTIESCIAQNCPPIAIDIDSIVPICLSANAATVDLSATIDPFDENATITWSGDGIIDADLGTFDPSVANPGSHLIVIDYLSDCPYSESILIEVLEQPVSTFTATDTICITETADIIYTGTFSSAEFSWEFDEGNATGNGSAPFEISWDTPGLKTVELQVDNQGCVSETVLVDVLVQDTLEPIDIQCSPNTNDITFSWDDIAESSGYLVTVNGVEIGVQSTTSYFVDDLEPGNIVDISVVALSTNKCSDVNDFESCTALNCPPVLIDLSTDETSICLDADGDLVQINADIIGGEEEADLTWIGTAVDQNGMFNPVQAGVGTYDIILEYDNLDCQEYDTITLTVLATPVAIFEAAPVICISDSLDLLFTGNLTMNSILTWNNPNGIVIGDGAEYTTAFNETGSYNIDLTVEENGCISEVFSLEIEVQEEIQLPAPGFDCEASTESIMFSWPSMDCVSSYVVFVDGVEQGTFTDTDFEVLDLFPDQAVDFEILAISDCACGDQVFSVSCNTEACTDLQLEVVETDAICFDESAEPFALNFNVIGNPDIGVLIWSGAGVDLNGVFDPVLAGPGNHLVSLSFDIGNCNYADNGIIRVLESPTAEIISSDPSCSGETNGLIEINAEGGTGELTYFINNQPLNGNSIDTLSGDTYLVSVVDENMCMYNETIVLNAPSAEGINITGNAVVIAGDSNLYSINTDISIDNINNITWFTEDGTVLCQGVDCLTFEFAPESDMNVCAIVDYGQGCMTEDCIMIRAEEIKRVYIPNTFTPNEDGINDFWNIFPNDEVISMPLIQVYNRWGEKMYEEVDLALDGSSPSWDGQFKGRRLNPGVYVYSLNVVYADGSTEIIQGDITIVN